ncbi:M23 family metallopeptidase [Lutispora thermophila]|nr:M23 family metallopeptidase [Lutispora thermophila]
MVYISGINPDDTVKVTSNLKARSEKFFPYKKGQLAIVGVSCTAEPGEYRYDILISREGKILREVENTIIIKEKNFKKDYITVSKEVQEKKSQENLNSDTENIAKAKANPIPQPLYEGVFIAPVDAEINTEFGAMRYVNGVRSSVHSGLDFKAKKGTPVMASNNGKVVLAMELNASGNTVILDHGLNIYTSYCHLDTISVEVGDMVQKGDIVGNVGSTGYSTGPHLHWTFSIGRQSTNPIPFMEGFAIPDF